MVFIYSPKATPADLLTNGIGRIDASKCTVKEELNGAFSISLEIPVKSTNSQYFVGEAIVRAMTPRGIQYFRLAKPKTIMKIKSASGWHISYDLAADLILNSYYDAKTGAQALPLILSSGISETRFTGTSDITTINNMSAVRGSILSALMGDKQDNCFLKKWGGEIERNNFVFDIKSQIGSDNGVRIAFKKNLTGFTLDEDFSKVATRIVPTCLNSDDTVLMLPEIYIDSARINDYALPRIYAVNFDNIKVGEETEGIILYPNPESAMTEMRARVAAMYAKGADLPTASASVEFVLLQDTDEYRDYAPLETISLGDVIHCDYRGVNLIRRVCSYEYDSLKKRYIKVNLGDIKKTLADTMYAQDISLDALKNDMTGTVKQGEKYNNVYINHINGFVAECVELNSKAVMNGEKMGYYDINSGAFLGGMANMNGIIGMVASMFTNALTSDFYMVPGDVVIDSDTYRGLFGYLKSYSTTVPFFKILAAAPGGIGGNQVLRIDLLGKLELLMKYSESGMRIISLGGKYGTNEADMPSIGITRNTSGTIKGINFSSGSNNLAIYNSGVTLTQNGVTTDLSRFSTNGDKSKMKCGGGTNSYVEVTPTQCEVVINGVQKAVWP